MSQRAHSLAIDPDAESARKDTPGFLARPAGAPAYHGFRILDDVVVDGFTLGAITDFETEHCDEGDAFVIAPDGSRAGLVWRISDDAEFQEVCSPTGNRWGVWAAAFPFEMSSRENAKSNLRAILPKLKAEWEGWQRKYGNQGSPE